MKSDLPAKEEFLSLKSLSGYIGDFISYMQMARGMSPNTCKSYERDLILFAGFLMNGNIDQAVKDCFFKVSEVDAALVSLDSGVIKSFVSALTVKGYSPASINRILSGVRGLYTYLYRYGITSSNPGSGVKSLKQGKKLPSFLFEEEVKAFEKLFNSLSDTSKEIVRTKTPFIQSEEQLEAVKAGMKFLQAIDIVQGLTKTD